MNPRDVLRDKIAAKLFESSGQSLNASDWLSEKDARWLAGAVLELFPNVSVDGPAPYRFLLRSAPVATRDKIAQVLWDMATDGAQHRGRPTPQCYEDARAVLDALAAAGLLLPEGAETRTEYGVEHTYPGQEPIGLPAVNRWAAERAAGQTGGVAQRRLVERTTWSTPWRPVDAEGRAVGQEAPGEPLSRDVSAGGAVGRQDAEGRAVGQEAPGEPLSRDVSAGGAVGRQDAEGRAVGDSKAFQDPSVSVEETPQ